MTFHLLSCLRVSRRPTAAEAFPSLRVIGQNEKLTKTRVDFWKWAEGEGKGDATNRGAEPPTRPSTPVVVRIGRPESIDDGRNCRCDYEIEGLSALRRAWFGGVDGAQALWMALVGVGIVLRTSEEGRDGRITRGRPPL
jgi:hypothetical protein